jgi:hypothetical protein
MRVGSQRPVARLRPREPRNKKPPSGGPSHRAVTGTALDQPGSEETGWQGTGRRPRPSSESDSHSSTGPGPGSIRSAAVPVGPGVARLGAPSRSSACTPARERRLTTPGGNSVAVTERTRPGRLDRASLRRAMGQCKSRPLGRRGASPRHGRWLASGWAGPGRVTARSGQVYAGAT